MRTNPSQLSAVFVATLAVLAALAPHSGLARDLDDSDRNALIFGQPQSGRIIVDDLKKTCTHLASALRAADREQRTLVFTNVEANAFHTYVCKGPCDMLQQNNATVECRQTIGVKGCRIYGAVYRGEVFQFSIDPAGTVLETDCDLKK
jgi:hypothetical protein